MIWFVGLILAEIHPFNSPKRYYRALEHGCERRCYACTSSCWISSSGEVSKVSDKRSRWRRAPGPEESHERIEKGACFFGLWSWRMLRQVGLGFETTAESTIFRKMENGKLTLFFSIRGWLSVECQRVADQLSDCYKCKKTGFLERDAQGSFFKVWSRWSFDFGIAS